MEGWGIWPLVLTPQLAAGPTPMRLGLLPIDIVQSRPLALGSFGTWDRQLEHPHTPLCLPLPVSLEWQQSLRLWLCACSALHQGHVQFS